MKWKIGNSNSEMENGKERRANLKPDIFSLERFFFFQSFKISQKEITDNEFTSPIYIPSVHPFHHLPSVCGAFFVA